MARSSNYEYVSDFAKAYVAQGKAEGLAHVSPELAVLSAVAHGDGSSFRSDEIAAHFGRRFPRVSRR